MPNGRECPDPWARYLDCVIWRIHRNIWKLWRAQEWVSSMNSTIEFQSLPLLQKSNWEPLKVIPVIHPVRITKKAQKLQTTYSFTNDMSWWISFMFFTSELIASTCWARMKLRCPFPALMPMTHYKAFGRCDDKYQQNLANNSIPMKGRCQQTTGINSNAKANRCPFCDAGSFAKRLFNLRPQCFEHVWMACWSAC